LKILGLKRRSLYFKDAMAERISSITATDLVKPSRITDPGEVYGGINPYLARDYGARRQIPDEVTAKTIGTLLSRPPLVLLGV
jgi:hypothetical protein